MPHKFRILHQALFTIMLTSYAFSSHADIQKDPADIFAELSPSLCAVLALDRSRNEIGWGSAFVLERSGTLVSNAHVVESAHSVHVECDGKKGSAHSVIRYKKGVDLVVIDTDLSDLKPAPIGTTKSIRPGSSVFVLGNPYGLRNTITTGLVSQEREINGQRYLQVSAQVNPGSSGGPVVDKGGYVIAVTTLGIREAKGLNFALPVDLIKGLPRISMSFDDISDTGSRGIDDRSTIVSTLKFRNTRFGTTCSSIPELVAHYRKMRDDAISYHNLIRDLIRDYPFAYFMPDLRKALSRSTLNPSGANLVPGTLLGMKVPVGYECRYGKLTEGYYPTIPSHLLDRVRTGLISKYGRPTDRKCQSNLKVVCSDIWEPGEEQYIRLGKRFGLTRLSYTDRHLEHVLEKKEALRSADGGEL